MRDIDIVKNLISSYIDKYDDVKILHKKLKKFGFDILPYRNNDLLKLLTIFYIVDIEQVPASLVYHRIIISQQYTGSNGNCFYDSISIKQTDLPKIINKIRLLKLKQLTKYNIF